MNDGPEISNDSRSVHEKLKWHCRVFAIILFDNIPGDKTRYSNNEWRKYVGGAPGILLATPGESDNYDTEVVSAQDQWRATGIN